jgi:hypothetical protein
MKEKLIAEGGRQKRTRIAPRLLLCLSLIGGSFASDGWVVREDGVGPVKIGMTQAQLSATLHERLSEDESGSDNCFYVHARGHDHISFMILEGKLVRVDVDSPGIATFSGVQVGDSEAHARQIYGAKLKVTEHKYIDTGHYLTVRSADGNYGVRFETDKGRIIEFYAGNYEAIQYVEGCE